MSGAQHNGFSGRTAWARNLETPLRTFLRTETGSAAFLLAASIAALVWVNVDAALLRARLGHDASRSASAITASREDLQYWLNSGLMTFFFFVVGLEARREFDMGELRERRAVALPVAAGLCGMLVPVLIYVAVQRRQARTRTGWGVAMSTDTAFALGMLALVGPRFPDRLRAFMLTVAVVDDIVALVVIATVYTTDVKLGRRSLGAARAARRRRVARPARRAARARRTARSAPRRGSRLIEVGHRPGRRRAGDGADDVRLPAARVDLERATDLFRLFREQPTPELARERVDRRAGGDLAQRAACSSCTTRGRAT